MPIRRSNLIYDQLEVLVVAVAAAAVLLSVQLVFSPACQL